MKNSIKKIFFGVVLLGSYQSYGTSEIASKGEFKSLRDRSPFGDMPKPEPKPQPKTDASKPASAAAPVPQKPEKNLMFTGYMKVGNEKYFSICDKTAKDPVRTVLVSGKQSPLGYAPGVFDPLKRSLELKVDGHSYTCVMGEEEKKLSASSNTQNKSNPKAQANPSYPSNPPSSSYPGYNNNGWNWDEWDDDDDFDW